MINKNAKRGLPHNTIHISVKRKIIWMIFPFQKKMFINIYLKLIIRYDFIKPGSKNDTGTVELKGNLSKINI